MAEHSLVCVPDAIPAEQRGAHFALVRELFGRLAVEQRDLPDGFAITFAPNVYDELVRFVRYERACCPAIRFEIDVGANAADIELRLRGPAGAREFLKAELPLR